MVENPYLPSQEVVVNSPANSQRTRWDLLAIAVLMAACVLGSFGAGYALGYLHGGGGARPVLDNRGNRL